MKTDPATIIVKGSQFAKTGTYYAGITANEYINFYKITVTKSPSKEDDSSKPDDSSLAEVTWYSLNLIQLILHLQVLSGQMHITQFRLVI